MSEDRVGALARLICMERGVDPDATAFGYVPGWRAFEGWARVILADPPILEPWRGESDYRQMDRRALSRLEDGARG